MATKIRVKGDPNPKVVVSEKIIPAKTPADDRLDVRDILSNMVGGGHTSLSNDDLRANYTFLKGKVGEQAAQKLINAASLYSQRPEVKNLNPEQRVQGFYDLGSNDPEVAQYLKQGKGLGYGVVNGLMTSPLRANMLLTGRNVGGGAGDKSTADKIRLLVKNTTK